MLIEPIDYFLAVLFLSAIASIVYIGVDLFRHNPERRRLDVERTDP